MNVYKASAMSSCISTKLVCVNEVTSVRILKFWRFLINSIGGLVETFVAIESDQARLV